MNVQKLRIIGLFAFSALCINTGNATLSYASANSSITTRALDSRGEKRASASPQLLAVATRHFAKNVYADDGIYSLQAAGQDHGSQPMTTVVPIVPVENHKNFASFQF